MIDIKDYPYKYEMHLHTSEGSACGKNTGDEMAKACKEAGYDGIFVTNHAWGGNTAVDRSLPWEEWIDAFAVGYRKAKEWGDKNGLKVFWGYESGYNATEFLIYGVTPEWMKERHDLKDASIEEQLKIVHEGGGIVIHAHPYREEFYIPEIRLFPEYVDGVEGVNATHSNHLSQAHNNPEFDTKAIEYAKKHNLPMSAGSDVHTTTIFGGGIMTSKPINDPKDWIRLLKSDEMYLMTNGDHYYDRYGNFLQ